MSTDAQNTTTDANKSSTPKKCFPRISLGKFARKVKKKINNKFICDNCEERFPTWWDRRDHWLSSGHKTKEQCAWCGKKTFALQSHLCKQHWALSSICPNCGQMFMFQEDLKKHQLQHSGSEYRCHHCGRGKKDEQLLRIHVESHFSYEKYGCNICEKRFKKKKNLENHLINIHFICQYCGTTSDDKEDYAKHVKIHSDLKCQLCKKVFSTITRLKYHYQLLHSHQDFFSCSQCSQRFSKKSDLLNHIRLRHKGESNFRCEICSAPFLYWQQYQNHFELYHKQQKNESKYDCSFCDFSTNLGLKLKWHIEKSSGLGFFCKKCKLRLECKGTFNEHMANKHTGETIWGCDYCSQSYKTDARLRLHVVVEHPNEAIKETPNIYFCIMQHCDRMFTTKSSLSRHLRKRHVVSSPNKSSVSINNLNREKHDDKNNTSVENHPNFDGCSNQNKQNCGEGSKQSCKDAPNHIQQSLYENSNQSQQTQDRQYTPSHDEVSDQSKQSCDEGSRKVGEEDSNQSQLSHNRHSNQSCDYDSNCSQQSLDESSIHSHQRFNKGSNLSSESFGESSTHSHQSKDKDLIECQTKLTKKTTQEEVTSSDMEVSEGECTGNINMNLSKSSTNKEKKSNKSLSASLNNESKVSSKSQQRKKIKSNNKVTKAKHKTPHVLGDASYQKKFYRHMAKPLSSVENVDVFNCMVCKKIWFEGESQFEKHMMTHDKIEWWDDKCSTCDIDLATIKEAMEHFVVEHLKVEFS